MSSGLVDHMLELLDCHLPSDHAALQGFPTICMPPASRLASGLGLQIEAGRQVHDGEGDGEGDGWS